jgi:uncharacterized protein
VDSATVLMWQGSAAPSLEIAAIEVSDGCLTARGTSVRAAPEPCAVSYRLETTDAYVTVSLGITAWGADWSRSLELRRGADGAWTADPGGSLPQLAGALDCDVAYCCLTNTMPVLRNRLHSRVGTAELLVAWVSLPDLRVHADRQRYRHLARAGGGAVVRFESGRFSADVEFDAAGFVVDYPGLARRVR